VGSLALYESFNRYFRKGAAGWQSRGGQESGTEWRREAKSYDREKAWPSMNHSILSGIDILGERGGRMAEWDRKVWLIGGDEPNHTTARNPGPL
jgi:hypothetical protein